MYPESSFLVYEPLTTGTLWCRGNELEAWQTQGQRQGAVGPKALMQDSDSWESGPERGHREKPPHQYNLQQHRKCSLGTRLKENAKAYTGSLVAQTVKNPPAVQQPQVQSLGWEDSPLEKGMATHPSILACRIPWLEEPGGLQSMGSQRVGHD